MSKNPPKPPKPPKEPEIELKPLSRRHQVVLDEYLLTFSQVKAYQKAYPTVTYDSAKSAAARLFATANFSSHLQSRLDEVRMSADEAVKLLSDMARADIGQFAEAKGNGWIFDMEKAKKSGMTKLIKKIKQKTTVYPIKGLEETELEIELHDSQAAIDKVLRIHGKYKDNLNLQNFDLSKLTEEQLTRLANGEDIVTVLLTTQGAGTTGTNPSATDG